MPQIKSNFTLKSRASNFERDSFMTLKEMRNVNPGHMDDGHISYCNETRKHYVFNMSNEFDGITGYFRLLTTGVSEGGNNSNTTISNVVFDTLKDMRNDDTVSQLGQIVYCKETESHYYYAYNPAYNALDPNQIEYDEVTGYFRSLVIEPETINRLESELSKISNKLWPAQFSVGGTSGTYRQGSQVNNVYITWSMTKENTLIYADAVKVNDTNINDIDIVKSGRYDLDSISSPDTSAQTSSVTNSVAATYGDSVKTGSNTISFIYPKYYGWIEGSDDELGENIFTPNLTSTTEPSTSQPPVISSTISPNSIFNYIKSGELLNSSKSQQFTIPNNVGMARWMYLYPSSLGSINSIKDGNGFDLTASSSEITINDPVTKKDITYKLYMQKSSADLSNITIKIS